MAMIVLPAWDRKALVATGSRSVDAFRVLDWGVNIAYHLRQRTRKSYLGQLT